MHPRTSKTNRRGREPRRPVEDTPPGVGWRIAGVCVWTFVPLVLLAAMAGGILYVRLLNGPISLKFLAQPIAKSLSGELGDYALSVDDAIARLTPSGDIEFRLRDVQLLDPDRRAIAVAPLAAFSLSGEALWSGRLTPERIVLIEPRADLVVAAPAPNPGSGPPPQAPRRNVGPPAPEVAEPTPVDQVDFVRTITRSISTSSPSGAGRFLKQLGFRQATLVLDTGGRKVPYPVIDGEIDLDQWRRTGMAVARINSGTPRAPWTMVANIQRSANADAVTVTANINGFVPSAALVPEQSRVLSALSAPISAQVEAILADDGAIRTARGIVEIGGPGTYDGIPVQNGRLAWTFDGKARRLDLTPSSLTIDGKVLQLIGAAQPEAADMGGAWRFALRTQQGLLSGPNGRPLAIDQFDIDGRWDGNDGTVDVTRGVLRTNGSEISFTARLPGGDREGPKFEARTGALSLDILRAIWPQGIAVDGRQWVFSNLQQGRLTAATLKVEGLPPHRRALSPRITMTAEAADIAFQPLPGWPIVDASRALVRMDDNGLEISIPEAATGPQTRRLSLRQGRFFVADPFVDYTQGEVTVRAQGPLGGALTLLDGEQKTISRQLQTSFDGVEGRFEGQMKVTFPLDSRATFRDIHLEGKGRVTEGRGKALIGGLDVQGATLAIDLSDEAVDVQGDLLLQGVPAKLSGQQLLRGQVDQQPPIRITANLDASDRNQLGLDINHIVTGDVPIEILVQRNAGELAPRVQANLSGAELTLESLGWRKAAGRPATLQFDIAKGGRHKTELQNFRLSGDDIAINGWLGIDAQNRLRDLHFSDFVLNVISRLEVQGTLRGDNVWDLKVKGNTYDGRDFFRSLLQVGRAVEPAPGTRAASRPGMDLRVEIDTVLGNQDTSLRNVRMQLSRRNDKLTALQARALLDGKPLDITVAPVGANDPRRMVINGEDAGQFFKLVGFYPNAQGGRMRLSINLDGKGPAEKTGLLEVAGFRILGDPVVYEVLSGPADTGGGQSGGRRETRVVRQAIDFDRMRAPFSIGHGQFVLEDADLRGPLLGATFRGKVDFKSQTLQIGGTYVPLQGLNSALGVIPGLGQILAGPRGEGVLGITFAIQGSMAQPQVIVNPLSLVAPGIFREMFQMTNPTPKVTPRGDGPDRPGQPAQSASPPASGPSSANQPPRPWTGPEGWMQSN